jgi:hypothetical protein
MSHNGLISGSPRSNASRIGDAKPTFPAPIPLDFRGQFQQCSTFAFSVSFWQSIL